VPHAYEGAAPGQATTTTATANRDSETRSVSEDLPFIAVVHAPPLSLFLSVH
jgi:hypothetical protein